MESGSCPLCGFAPRTVSPSDAAVAVLSYPRRFRALLVRPDEDGEPTPEDLVLRRPPGGGLSALEHAARVAEVMSLGADALDRIRIQDRPSVQLDPPGTAPATDIGSVLDRLTAVDLLHVDDVGAERTTDWVLEELYSIVNARYEDQRSMVITTNILDREALCEQISERTVSRLTEMCDEVPLLGEDRRMDLRLA